MTLYTTLDQYETCVMCRTDTYLCIATSPYADFLTATCVSLRFDLDLDTTRNLRDPLGLESLWVNRNLENNGGFEALWVVLQVAIALVYPRLGHGQGARHNHTVHMRGVPGPHAQKQAPAQHGLQYIWAARRRHCHAQKQAP